MALCAVLSASTAEAHNARRVANFTSPSSLTAAIDGFDSGKQKLDAVFVTPNGDWLLVSGKTLKRNTAFPDSFFNAIKTKVSAGRRVVAGDCNEVGACAVVYDDWSSNLHSSAKVPSCFSTNLSKYKTSSWQVKDVEITDAACVFLGTGGQATYSTSLDPELKAALLDRNTSGRSIESLSIGFDQEWALVAGHSPMFSGVPLNMLGQALENAARINTVTNQVVIGIDGDYIWYGQGTDPAAKTTPIGAIEWGLGTGSTNIWKRMQDLGITGASVALISQKNGAPVVSTARGYGRRRADDGLPIIGRTPFALASLSKYLGAVATADQVEGDANVTPTTDLITSTYLPTSGALKTWKATGENANSNFRKNLSSSMGDSSSAPLAKLRTPITLDCMMTHSCSIVAEGGGASVVRRPLWAANDGESTLNWLLGRNCDGTSCSTYANQTWQVNTTAGSYEYHSANYLVIQAYLEDATGKSAIPDLLSTERPHFQRYSTTRA